MVCRVTKRAARRSTAWQAASPNSNMFLPISWPAIRHRSARQTRLTCERRTGAAGRRVHRKGKQSLSAQRRWFPVKHELVTKKSNSPACSSSDAITSTSIGKTGATKTIPGAWVQCTSKRRARRYGGRHSCGKNQPGERRSGVVENHIGVKKAPQEHLGCQEHRA